MRRPGYFFLRLLTMALVVAVPLLVVHAWTLFDDLESEQQRAYKEVEAKSWSTARTVEANFAKAERLLAFVAGRPEIRSLDPAQCNAFIRGLHGVDSLVAAISVSDRGGRVYCVSDSDVGLPPTGVVGDWLSEAGPREAPILGKPSIEQVAQRPLVPLSLAVRDADGNAAAVAVVWLDLLQLQALMVSDWSASGGVLALVDADFRFLVRSPDTLKWLGRTASNAVKSLRPNSQNGIITAPGVDGVERVFASSDVSKYKLRVAASIPADEVLALARAQIRNGAAVAAAALALAAALAYVGAHSITRPVRSLGTTARAVTAGQADALADESLPGEFKELAVEMNRMQAARRASEHSALRLSRFYEALSRANQAMLRVSDPVELYKAIAEVCFETGHASMAWIGVIDGYQLIPVAWGGPAELYTRSLELDLGPLAQPAGGAFGASVLSGKSRVANDYMNDPRTIAFRENATRFDVRSSAIVPFWRDGTVAGTLNLYAGEVGFFDEGLMRLLAAMAADISLALDVFDKAAVHARTSAELAKREAQLSGILESATVAIVTIDANQRIVVFNNAASKMFDVPVVLAIGQHSGVFIPERFRATHGRDIQSYLHSDGANGGSLPRPLTGLRSDGSEFPVEASTFRTSEGADELITLVMRDLSVERDAAQARIAAASSDAANRAKTEFLSRMSHELRTPLNAVLGFAQLIQEGAKERLHEIERHQLDLIFLAGAQLRALVDDLLDVSIIESGQMSLSLVDFELVGLLNGVMRMSEAAARVAQVELIASYSSMNPQPMHSDPIRLRQVMLNLVSNAIKYNHACGSITVSLELFEGRLRIAVADTGMGMTKTQLAALFEPFNRLGREGTRIEGTGIGMTLVRQLVELLGGTISVTSQPGVGTTVQVELPMPRDGDVLAKGFETTSFRVSGQQALGPEPSGLVLYIEDNPVNVLVIQGIFRRWPAVQLVVAEDGATGIDQAQTLRPDIVLLDMHLPDMSGLDVLTALRGNALTSDLRVVALSASGMPEEVKMAREAGVHGYWTKPVDVASFSEGITALLSAVEFF